MSRNKKNKRRKTSQKQIEANRLNAQKSTGPNTAKGKEESSRNALDHGGYGGRYLLPEEDPQIFDEFLEGIFHSMQPRNDLEAEYCLAFVWACWHIKRVMRQLTRSQAELSEDIVVMNRETERLSKVLQRLERSRDRARKQFYECREQAYQEHQTNLQARIREATKPPIEVDDPVAFFQSLKAGQKVPQTDPQASAQTLAEQGDTAPPEEKMGSFRALQILDDPGSEYAFIQPSPPGF